MEDCLERLLSLIRNSENIVLSTHKQCDGDGLGAQMALYFALQKFGKKVYLINVDQTPRKYKFLRPDDYIQYFDKNQNMPSKIDLCIIFDTNDERLIYPLFHEFKKANAEISFIDHHPVLEVGPQPTHSSWIDTSCASTGEMSYKIIKALNIPLDNKIATCLYTSITFDTQLFRYIRSSAVSHQIAAEMLEHNVDTELIHRHLFGLHSMQKIKYLAKTLGEIEYHVHGQLAFIKILDSDLKAHNLEMDDSRDIIDFVMNIETVEVAALLRVDKKDQFKLSLRSKGQLKVLPIAEHFGGGGHVNSAGAFIQGDYEQVKEDLIQEIVTSIAKQGFKR